jgi:hypothetical protein
MVEHRVSINSVTSASYKAQIAAFHGEDYMPKTTLTMRAVMVSYSDWMRGCDLRRVRGLVVTVLIDGTTRRGRPFCVIEVCAENTVIHWKIVEIPTDDPVAIALGEELPRPFAEKIVDATIGVVNELEDANTEVICVTTDNASVLAATFADRSLAGSLSSKTGKRIMHGRCGVHCVGAGCDTAAKVDPDYAAFLATSNELSNFLSQPDTIAELRQHGEDHAPAGEQVGKLQSVRNFGVRAPVRDRRAEGRPSA